MPTIPANNNTGLYNTPGNAVPTDGNISTNNITASGNVTVGGYIVANGSITTNANFVGNLVGNVTGNITLGGGNREVIYNNSGVTGSSPNFTFNSTTNVLDVNGNIDATYFIGNGSQLTGLPASYGNANVVSLLAGFGSNTISTTGNITGGYILGNGSQLTGLPATYGNANVSAFLPTYTGNLNPNTVVASGNITGLNLKTSGAGGNITGVNYVVASFFSGDGSLLTNLPGGGTVTQVQGAGVVSGLSLTGNVTTTGNLTLGGTLSLASVTGNISTTGNVTGGYIFGNGSQLTGIAASYGNAEVAAFLPTYTGAMTAMTGAVTTTANISGAYLIGNGSALSSITGANVVGTVSSATTATTAGTVTTAAQANITSVGTLTSLAVSGNVSGGNVSAVGNIAASYFIGNGSQLTGITAGGTGTVTSVQGAGVVSGLSLTGNVTTAGNLTLGGTLDLSALSGNISTTGNITGGNVIVDPATGQFKIGVATIGNFNNRLLFSDAELAGVLNFATTGQIATSGNISTPANISAVGNITGAYILGNGSQLTGLTTTAPGGSNTQIQYNNAGAFGGAAVFAFNNSTGNVTAGNIVIQANTTTTGAAQNIYTNSNQYLGNTATTPILGRMLFGSGLATTAGGSGDFSNNVDINSNMRGARMILADRFQKTDTGIRSRSFVISNMVDVSGNIGTANANSRLGSFVSEMFIGGGNSVSTNPAMIIGQSAGITLGTSGNATVGNTAVTAATSHLAFTELRPNSSLTSMLAYNPSFTNSTGNATAWTNAYGITPSTGGNAAIANFSLVHMQNASGLGWGVSATVPPTNYYFLNNTDVRSESIVGPIRQYQDKTYLEATGSGTVAVDWDNGTSQVINLTGDMTLTFQDPTVGTTNQRLIHTVTLVIYQDATGRAVTLPTASSTYRYAGGSSTVGTTASSVTMITVSAIRVSGATQYLITVSPEFTG